MTAKYPLRVIENYSYSQRLDQIGKTSKSTVYKGYEIFTNQPVAIKILPKTNQKKAQIENTLFEGQVQSMFTLKGLNQHIIQVYNAYETDYDKYIVMEYCPNGDLQKIIQNEQLTQNQAICYVKQIFAAYMCLVQNCILHRDLKPANIFVSEQGVLKLADFGYAHKGNVKARDCMMKSKINVGSPSYMPLQSLQKSIYSFKSDIWAIGIIFYEMLTGTMPWIAKNEEQLIRKINSIDIQDLIPDHISAFSKQFLLKSLQVSASDRATPQELYQLIKTFANQIDVDDETDIETVNLQHSESLIDIKKQEIKAQEINVHNYQKISMKKDTKQLQTQVSDDQQQNDQFLQLFAMLSDKKYKKMSFQHSLAAEEQILRNSNETKPNIDQRFKLAKKAKIGNKASSKKQITVDKKNYFDLILQE